MKIVPCISNFSKVLAATCFLICIVGCDNADKNNSTHSSSNSLINQVPLAERAEVKNLLEKAKRVQIDYVVAFGNIQIFRTDNTIRRFVVGNGAADKVLGTTQGSMPNGYARWELGVNAFPMIDKKAKKIGFKHGYRDDVLYIFFKDWKRPIVFQLSKL